MKVHDDHMYHGAALIQIAEDVNFTAINSLRVHGQIVRAAYKVNDHIAVYIKHAVKPTPKFKEFTFTFTSENIRTIRAIAGANDKTFIAMVCVNAREICLISADQLHEMLASRQTAYGGLEDQYTVLVTAPAKKGLRVYMNQPGRRKIILGKELIVSRSSFPSDLFV
jgi:hypothetical protein